MSRREYRVQIARDTIETAETVVVGATSAESAQAEALARARAGQLDFEPVQFRIGGEPWVHGWWYTTRREDEERVGYHPPLS
jgi:hypothetical protein